MIYTTFGSSLILKRTNGRANSSIMMDPMKMYERLYAPIIIPPIIAALNSETLNINRKIPFPNSGDSLTEDVTQYWTIV